MAPASTVNFLSNEDTPALAPGFFILLTEYHRNFAAIGKTKEASMRTLVVYATKYGLTGEYAQAMANRIGKGTTVLDLASSNNIDLKPYDNVIIGTPIYAGRPRPLVNAFIKARSDELLTKNLALFLCGLTKASEATIILETIYPAHLRAAAKTMALLPGFINKEKANAIERFIIRMIEKSELKKGGKPSPKEAPNIEAQAEAFIKETGFIH